MLFFRDTVREIPGTGREIGTRETGGKLDPGNPGKAGKKIVHFSRVVGGNFENSHFFFLQQGEKVDLGTKVSVIYAFLHCICKPKRGLIPKPILL